MSLIRFTETHELWLRRMTKGLNVSLGDFSVFVSSSLRFIKRINGENEYTHLKSIVRP